MCLCVLCVLPRQYVELGHITLGFWRASLTTGNSFATLHTLALVQLVLLLFSVQGIYSLSWSLRQRPRALRRPMVTHSKCQHFHWRRAHREHRTSSKLAILSNYWMATLHLILPQRSVLWCSQACNSSTLQVHSKVSKRSTANLQKSLPIISDPVKSICGRLRKCRGQ